VADYISLMMKTEVSEMDFCLELTQLIDPDDFIKPCPVYNFIQKYFSSIPMAGN
jgi:hypothetical protein